jgi:hypothetical protein
VFDEFILQLTTALGAEIWTSHKCELDKLFTEGPFGQLTRPSIDRAIDHLVEDVAKDLVENFLDKLAPHLPTIEPPPPTKPSILPPEEPTPPDSPKVPPTQPSDPDVTPIVSILSRSFSHANST